MAVGQSGKFYANPQVMHGMNDSPREKSIVQRGKPEHHGPEENPKHEEHKVEVTRKAGGGYHTLTSHADGSSEDQDHANSAEVGSHIDRVFQDNDSDDQPQIGDTGQTMELPGVNRMVRGEY